MADHNDPAGKTTTGPIYQGLEYSMKEGYSNPRIAKAFNVIEALKASPSKLAGHISANWNPYIEWLRRIELVRRIFIA